MIDGGLAPSWTNEQGVATLTRIASGTVDACTIVAWWDRSADTRPGCNAAIIVPGVKPFGQCMNAFCATFPTIHARMAYTITQAVHDPRSESTEPIKWDYTREELIEICERAMVPVGKWRNRDTPGSIRKAGECWAYLKCGCEFRVTRPDPDAERRGCHTDHHTIWLHVDHPVFDTFETGGPHDSDHYYLPTPARLDARDGRDWYR